MIRILIIIGIACVIFILTYFGAKKGKIEKACVFSGLAAALCFIGPYVVDMYVDENQTHQEASGDTQNNIDDTQGEESISRNEEEKETENDESVEETDTTVLDEEYESKETENNVSCITFMGETHEPSDTANQVSVSGWEQNVDYDISGKTYDGGVKISIYNMFSALDGNSSNISNEITSEIHYALNSDEIEKLEKKDQCFEGKFVVCKETNGSPSTAIISILLDGEEVYNSGEINCYSLDVPPFNVPLTDKKEMVIKTVCQHKGNPLIIGMVNNE